MTLGSEEKIIDVSLSQLVSWTHKRGFCYAKQHFDACCIVFARNTIFRNDVWWYEGMYSRRARIHMLYSFAWFQTRMRLFNNICTCLSTLNIYISETNDLTKMPIRRSRRDDGCLELFAQLPSCNKIFKLHIRQECTRF